MSQSVALAIVHGTGKKDPDFAEDIVESLQEKFPTCLSEEACERADLVVEPVYWADLPREREEEVWDRVTAAGPMDNLEMRRFIFNLAGDTLAYQPSEGRRELYLSVHEKMADSFERLAERAGPEAPLCIIAHSMGSIVAHNFLYDMQHEEDGAYGGSERPGTALERAETLALFVTCGSPLAIWRLRFGDDYKAIRFPAEGVEERYPNLKPKWLNVYDEDDVLGYPISKLTDSYEEMAEAGYLEDREQNVGAFWKNWNPLSHKGYFRDDRSLDELARQLAEVWRGAFLEEEEREALREGEGSEKGLFDGLKSRLQ